MNENDKDFIIHEAVVKSINPEKNVVTVIVKDNDDCGGCPAAKLCSVSSEKNKGTEMPVSTINASEFMVGEKVEICGSAGLQKGAMLLAIIIPCVLLVGVMVGVYTITGDEALAALLGLATVVAVYFIFYLFRAKFAKKFSFTIRKLK